MPDFGVQQPGCYGRRAFMPDTINIIVPEGTPTIYRAGRRAFMPDTINIIVPKGTPTIYRAGRRAFMPDTINTIVPKGTPTNSTNSINSSYG